MKPEPPLAMPLGGVPAYVWMGPGPKLSPNEAWVALKFGGEWATTPMLCHGTWRRSAQVATGEKGRGAGRTEGKRLTR
jgi:hypothetical protein